MNFRYIAIIIAIVCILVFVFEIFFAEFVFSNFSLISGQVFHKPWTVITYMFLHSGLEHLFYNMFALVLFGSILEKVIGSKKFFLVFFIAGIFSAIGSILFYDSTVGASGAIFGILGVLGILRPRLMVWVLGIPVPMIIALGIWTLLDLIGFFIPDQIAHAGHLFGLIFGIAYGIKIRNQYKAKTNTKEVVLEEKEIDDWENKWIKLKLIKTHFQPFFQ